jgi:predicted nucleic acid-binding protein
VTGPDKAGALVLDASVLINLLGSGRPELLLRAIPEKVLMADRTFGEVLRDPSGRLPPREIRGALVSGGLIELRALDPDNLDIFIDLAAHPDALDDGEAATIAVAVGAGAVPVLDERKARRVFRERFPERDIESSAGLFRRLNEGDRLPFGTLRAALFDALCNARMNVVPDEMEWVLATLGEELAGQSSSLRRHRA